MTEATEEDMRRRMQRMQRLHCRCLQAQLCQNRLKAWLLQRQKCTDDAGVQSILERLTAEFNRKDVDYAFVYCHSSSNCRVTSCLLLSTMTLWSHGCGFGSLRIEEFFKATGHVTYIMCFFYVKDPLCHLKHV